MDTSTALALALIGGMATILAICFVIYILFVIAYWKIFTKAGIPGWKSIIPIYNSYIQYKFTWQTKYLWIMLALLIIGGCMTNIGGFYTSLYDTAGMVSPLNAMITAFQTGYTAAGIGYLLVLVAYLINAVSYYYLGQAFGHQWGFFVAALIVPFIALLYLGFGSSQYIGNKGADKGLLTS